MTTQLAAPRFTPAHASDRRAIKSVSVVTTGLIGIRSDHYYNPYQATLSRFLSSKQWVSVPSNIFIIEHTEGLVLFDAGMDWRISGDPAYYPDKSTANYMHDNYRFHINPDDTLTELLQLGNYSTTNVSTVVLSHLHFDHVGCIREVPQAQLIVSRQEWYNLRQFQPEQSGYFPEHLNIPGACWHRINFDSYDNRALERFSYTFDLWGDGTIILIPTPGHTSGSLSMLVRCEDSPPLLFVGDLTYELGSLERDEVPMTGNRSILKDTFSRVRALKLKLPNLIILSGHDPTVEALLSLSNLYRPMKRNGRRDHRIKTVH